MIFYPIPICILVRSVKSFRVFGVGEFDDGYCQSEGSEFCCVIFSDAVLFFRNNVFIIVFFLSLLCDIIFVRFERDGNKLMGRKFCGNGGGFV